MCMNVLSLVLRWVISCLVILNFTIFFVRQAWSHHYGLRNSQLLVLATSEHQFYQSEYEDYVAANTGSMACLHMVTLVVSSMQHHV